MIKQNPGHSQSTNQIASSDLGEITDWCRVFIVFEKWTHEANRVMDTLTKGLSMLTF